MMGKRWTGNEQKEDQRGKKTLLIWILVGLLQEVLKLLIFSNLVIIFVKEKQKKKRFANMSYVANKLDFLCIFLSIQYTRTVIWWIFCFFLTTFRLYSWYFRSYILSVAFLFKMKLRLGKATQLCQTSLRKVFCITMATFTVTFF